MMLFRRKQALFSGVAHCIRLHYAGRSQGILKKGPCAFSHQTAEAMDPKELEFPRNTGVHREIYLSERFHTMLTSWKTDQEPEANDESVTGRTTPWLNCSVMRTSALYLNLSLESGPWWWTWNEWVTGPLHFSSSQHGHTEETLLCFSLLFVALIGPLKAGGLECSLSGLQDPDFDPNKW